MASYFKVSERSSLLINVTVSVLLLMSCFISLEGQGTLNIVDSLASTGEVESARSILQAWWDGDRQEANRHDQQFSLWLRGILTVDPQLASLDFQRLVLSFPGGLYSDDALSRLGLISVANNDLLRASEYFRAILLDYPRSPKRRSAEEWLESNTQLVEEREIGLGSPDPQKQVAVLYENEPSTDETGEAPLGRYAIQVGAFSSNDRAKALANTLSKKGFDVRVVGIRGTALIRVRIGSFQERTQASILMQNLIEIGQVATLVDDVSLEVMDS